ncbi:unnamed protein product [Penicillium glandicola]
MRLTQAVFLSLLGLAAASPSPAPESSAVVAAEDFKPDWDACNKDFDLALEKAKLDPSLTKRLNTESANNVAWGQAVYAAGEAAVKQVNQLKDWNKAREQFTQLTTQIMIDRNPDPNTAVAAICYNMGYNVQNSDGIYGLRSQEISIWPASTDYDCFYMGKNNAFWSEGDGGSINLYTRAYTGACRFDDKSDLYC